MTAVELGPLLRLSDIVKTYAAGGDDVRVLDGVDLDVVPGEFVALKGPSGAGKSTLLQIAAGLDRPTSGEVRFDGRRLADFDEREMLRFRREEIGFVFQFFNLVPGLDVRDNVALPLLFDGRRRGEVEQTVAEAIAVVGLADRASQLASELSGGEMQRVAVARAIAPKPRLIFADEPTGNLDTHSGDAVLDLLAGACKERGAAVLMVTHEDRAAARADRVIEVRDGHISPHDLAVVAPSDAVVAAHDPSLE